MSPDAGTDGGVFDDLRVIEIGQFVAAPVAAELLAHGGADVVRIEPVEGDVTRRTDPLRLADPDTGRAKAESAAERTKAASGRPGQDIGKARQRAADAEPTSRQKQSASARDGRETPRPRPRKPSSASSARGCRPIRSPRSREC